MRSALVGLAICVGHWHSAPPLGADHTSDDSATIKFRGTLRAITDDGSVRFVITVQQHSFTIGVHADQLAGVVALIGKRVVAKCDYPSGGGRPRLISIRAAPD